MTDNPPGSIYGLFCACSGCRSTRPGDIRYVGRTIRPLARRLQGHIQAATSGEDTARSRWIRKHGVENIRVFWLDSGSGSRELDSLEIFWINHLDTYRSALNATAGGGGALGFNHSETSKVRIGNASKGSKNPNSIITEGQAKQIKELLWSGLGVSQVARKFEISRTTVSRILSGKSWNHVEWPIGPRYLPPKRSRPLGIKPSPETIAKRRASRGSLEDYEVVAIRERYLSGSPVRELATEYSRSRDTIYRILRGTLYTGIGDN